MEVVIYLWMAGYVCVATLATITLFSEQKYGGWDEEILHLSRYSC